jgi:phosphoglycerate dehydrogenase-like enzyme
MQLVVGLSIYCCCPSEYLGRIQNRTERKNTGNSWGGNVGSKVEKLAGLLGMNVILNDRRGKEKKERQGFPILKIC